MRRDFHTHTHTRKNPTQIWKIKWSKRKFKAKSFKIISNHPKKRRKIIKEKPKSGLQKDQKFANLSPRIKSTKKPKKVKEKSFRKRFKQFRRENRNSSERWWCPDYADLFQNIKFNGKTQPIDWKQRKKYFFENVVPATTNTHTHTQIDEMAARECKGNFLFKLRC